MRTVYLGTSEFAAAVLERLAGVAAPAGARRHAAGRRARARPASSRRRRSPCARASSGIERASSPSDLHDAGGARARSPPPRPRCSCVCAYGVLIKEPLLSDYEMLNVHPSLLPRWRGAAPVERAIMAGDAETGVSIMRAHRGAGLRAGLPRGARADPAPTTTTARSPRGCATLGGEVLVRALDERPPFVEQDEAGVTYAHKIEARDRALDPTRPPEEVERVVRALRPAHRRAAAAARRLVPRRASRARGRRRDARAGRRPRARRRRAAAARLQRRRARADRDPAARRPRRWRAADWLRGPPRPGAHRLLARPAAAGALARRADRDRDRASGTRTPSGRPTWPRWPGAATRRRWRRRWSCSGRDDPRARAVGAYVLGQLGIPERTLPGRERRRARAPRGGRGGPGGARDDRERVRPPRRAVRDRDAAAAAPPRRRARARGRSGRAGGPRRRARVRRAGRAHRATPSRASATGPRSRSARSRRRTRRPLRDALAARLDDSDDSTRIEAVHGLALRGDARALDAVLDLLGEVGPHDDGGNAADTIWKRYALTQATVRLAALTGDARLKEHLPGARRAPHRHRDRARPAPRLRPSRRPVTATNVTSTSAYGGRTTLVPERRLKVASCRPSAAALRQSRRREPRDRPADRVQRRRSGCSPRASTTPTSCASPPARCSRASATAAPRSCCCGGRSRSPRCSSRRSWCCSPARSATPTPRCSPSPRRSACSPRVVQFLGLIRWPFLVPYLARVAADPSAELGPARGRRHRLPGLQPLPRRRRRRAPRLRC